MIDWTKDILSWWTTGLAGLLLYWLPVAFCLIGYTMKCWGEYRRDVRESKKPYYSPHLHVGTIIGRAILSVTPIANLFAGIFDVAPRVFGDFLGWVERFFSIPIVKHRPPPTDKKAHRNDR